jgi:glucose/arabinose dehydrogenase
MVAGLEHPWSLAFLPDGGALVTERAGRLRLVSGNWELTREPIAGVPTVFNDAQAGLFDVLLSPDFEADQTLFLAYACGTAAANHLCVARGQLQGMALKDVVEIFRAKPAKQGSAHYGGRMAWLPDGTLIVTLGDGFDYREQAQDLSSHLGKIVRLNPDGTAPADNPFVDREDALPEIYSYGHRNVQGLVYDSVEGLLISHEHGPRGGDEINIIEPGHNYGWPVITHGIDYTGAMITPFVEREGMEQPLLHWTPSIAPSGMTRYRGELFPDWQGNLLVGALADRSVHRVTLEGRQASDVETMLEELGERIRDVATGPEGAVYLLTDSADGRVLRLLP